MAIRNHCFVFGSVLLEGLKNWKYFTWKLGGRDWTIEEYEPILTVNELIQSLSETCFIMLCQDTTRILSTLIFWGDNPHLSRDLQHPPTLWVSGFLGHQSPKRRPEPCLHHGISFRYRVPWPEDTEPGRCADDWMALGMEQLPTCDSWDFIPVISCYPLVI